jgi:ParB-like chromosome segregation protein Spo0J
MQNPEYIPLEMIDPNPFQTRMAEDPEHIAQIAASIKINDLLQAPMGRRQGDRIQLAFGHSRCAAFRQLNDELAIKDDPKLTPIDRLKYAFLPVILRDLTDQEMFELAVRENNDRKNLNAIETARAMARYREDFKKISSEIGALFGLSESAVRNKMRLLKLPPEIQNALMAEQITEGCARALIALYDLPEEVRQAGQEQNINPEIHPSLIVQGALAGSSPDIIASRIDKLERWYADKQLWEAGRTEVKQEPMESAPKPNAREWMKNVEKESAEESVDEVNDLEETPAESKVIPVSEPKSSAAEQSDDVKRDEDETQEEDDMPGDSEKSALSKLTDTIPTPEPIQTAAPAGPLSWLESTIVLTYTFYPDDGNEAGREVIVGARINETAPKLHFTRAAEIMPKRLADIYVELQNQIGG